MGVPVHWGRALAVTKAAQHSDMRISLATCRCQSLLWVTSAAAKVFMSGTVSADSVRWLGDSKSRTNKGSGSAAKAQGHNHSSMVGRHK